MKIWITTFLLIGLAWVTTNVPAEPKKDTEKTEVKEVTKPKPAEASVAAKDSVGSQLAKKLIKVDGETGEASDAKSKAGVEHYIFYHSAVWWGGCVPITAQLVQLYDKAGEDRKFEVIFFSHDQNQDAMNSYMKKSKMKFPGVKKDQMESVKDLFDLGNDGFVPCMVMADTKGDIIASQPQNVLGKLKEMIGE